MTAVGSTAFIIHRRPDLAVSGLGGICASEFFCVCLKSGPDGALHSISICGRQAQFGYQRAIAAVGMDEVKDRFSLYQDEPRGTLVVSKIEELQCRVLVAEVGVLSGKVVR